MHNFNQKDTIAAIATPAGQGSIGVIRISGLDSFEILSRFFNSKKDISKADTHTLHFGTFVTATGILDEVVVSLFKAPNSYTGENVIEISFHGSAFILKKAMEELLNAGARQAEPGEFTLRAFLNGKMDLSQAEAVADLIASESSAAHSLALDQMRGRFSNKIKELREKLLDFASMIELELDFSQEDVEFADKNELIKLLGKIDITLSQLIKSFELGNVIKNGIYVVIAGRPNSGKSTLLNAILEDERALVSEIPGTTRDTIEDTFVLDGLLFRFADTAGLHTTEDVIEKMGIERTLEKLKKAHIVIYLFDVSVMDQSDLEHDLDMLKINKPLIIAANKTDQTDLSEIRKKFSKKDIVYISAKEGNGLDDLKKQLLSVYQKDVIDSGTTIVSNIRHFEALKNALEAIQSVKTGIESNIPSDLLSIDIKRALHEMGQITGEITNDDVLGNIFSRFCIGK